MDILQQLINGLSLGALYALIAVGYVVGLALGDQPRFDVRVVQAVVDHRTPWLTFLFQAITWLGSSVVLIPMVAVTMVIVVGIATLLRRSWRVAAMQTVPIGIVYGSWWLRYSHGEHSFVGTARQQGPAWDVGALERVGG